MARFDDPTLANPFEGRIAELADSELTPERRSALLGELAVTEAEELAQGWRHLTIWHGDPSDLVASRHLSDFYEAIGEFASSCESPRVRGDARFVTITVAAADAERLLGSFHEAAEAANPGGWRIAAAAVPPNVG